MPTQLTKELHVDVILSRLSYILSPVVTPSCSRLIGIITLGYVYAARKEEVRHLHAQPMKHVNLRIPSIILR